MLSFVLVLAWISFPFPHTYNPYKTQPPPPTCILTSSAQPVQ